MIGQLSAAVKHEQVTHVSMCNQRNRNFQAAI